jgi:hypothetical protein
MSSDLEQISKAARAPDITPSNPTISFVIRPIGIVRQYGLSVLGNADFTASNHFSKFLFIATFYDPQPQDQRAVLP